MKSARATNFVNSFVVIFGAGILTYILFYLFPVFLNANNEMLFPEFVPSFPPIGIDFRWLWSIENKWKASVELFNVPNEGALHFPPLIIGVFSWAAFFSFQTAYKILTFLTLISYLSVTAYLPYRLSKVVYNSDTLWLIAIPFCLLGLHSYGLQFEIERGQWNLIAVTSAIWAIYLYHFGGARARGVAFTMVIIASQIKVYPLIFIFGFFSRDTSIISNFKVIGTLLLVNILLIFIFGVDVAGSFYDSIVSLAVAGDYGIAQISIDSFFLLAQERQPELLNLYIVLFFLSIMCAGYGFLSAIFVGGAKNNMIFLYLMLIVAMVLPSHGNDYKLSLMSLALPVILMSLCTRDIKQNHITNLFLFLFVFFVTSTFYSYATKPECLLIQNNFMNLILSSVFIVFLVDGSSPHAIWRSAYSSFKNKKFM